MRHQIAVALAAFALLAAMPRAARACGGGGGEDSAIIVVALGTVVLGGADVAMLISDVVITAEDEKPSVGHGVAELLLGLPTTLIGGILIGVGTTDSSSGAGYILFATAVTGVGLFMDAHAIWTFASQPPTTPPMHARRKVYGTAQLEAAALASLQPELIAPPPLPAYQLSVAPTVLAVRDRGTAEKLAPGLGAVLRF